MGFFVADHCKPRRIQRYLCLHCRRSFSSQTFATTYWLRRPELLRLIFQRSLGCSALRQIAADYDVAVGTVERHLARLGRHCLLYQKLHQPAVSEGVALDGFESFEYSQYFPFHFNVVAGEDSHFFYGFSDAPLRRKGAMTETQRRRRMSLEDRLGRADPKAIEHSVAELLARMVPEPGIVELYTDDHHAYPRALDRIQHLTIRHHVTSSKERRTSRNPLFPVNLLDLLIRHGGANHKRETIAFSKRRQGAIERLAILQVWRNFMRSFSVRKRGPTPAMRLGLRARKLTVSELLSKRLFASKVRLDGVLERYYRREVRTVALPVNRRHELQYAY